MQLNIVGELTRTESINLSKGITDVQYAELNSDGKISMFYKQDVLDKYLPNAPIIWYYLSYGNSWMGSSDDMSKKRLLKIVD